MFKSQKYCYAKALNLTSGKLRGKESQKVLQKKKKTPPIVQNTAIKES